MDHSPSFPPSSNPIHYDPRLVSWGAARAFMALLTFWSVLLIVSEFWWLREVNYRDYGWALSSLAGAFLWLVISLAIIHNGRRMRIVAWAGLCVQLLETFTLTMVGWYSDSGAQRSFLFFEGGATYFYTPIIFIVASVGWMLWFSPLRRA